MLAAGVNSIKKFNRGFTDASGRAAVRKFLTLNPEVVKQLQAADHIDLIEMGKEHGIPLDTKAQQEEFVRTIEDAMRRKMSEPTPPTEYTGEPDPMSGF